MAEPKKPQHKLAVKTIKDIGKLSAADKALLAKQDPTATKIIAQIFKIAEQMSKKDIATWFAARQAALQVQFPNRTQLYDLYSYPLELDAHMRFLMRKVSLFIKSAKHQTLNKDGKPNEQLEELFSKHWFRQYQFTWAKSDFQGFALLQLNNADPVANTIEFEEVPRKHVVPEKGAWIKFQSTNAYNVYRDTPDMDYLIEIGEKYNLGWLDVAAPLLLYKRNAMICWADFCERFGLPLVIGKTNVKDQQAVSKMEQGVKNLSKKSAGVIDLGDEIQLVQNAHADAYEVFDAKIERCNNELSKMILLNIMSADVGKNGSFAQSKTHGEMEDQAREEKKADFEGHVNEILLPFLTKHGWNTTGAKFSFLQTFSVDNDQFLQDMWADENFEIDVEFYKNKYGWPITARKTPPAGTEPPPPVVETEKLKTKIKPNSKFARYWNMHVELKSIYQHEH